MLKRSIAVFLCLVMLFAMLPVSAVSAEESNARQVVEEGGSKTSVDGNVTISKTIAPTEKENYFDITLTVTDRDIIQETSTDVVLVLDISNTMTNVHSGNAQGDNTTRFENARAAAVSFATQYANSPDLGTVRRLGVVTFNTDAKVAVQLEQVSRNTVNQIQGMSLTKNNNDPKRFTNIEGGLKQAQAMLSRSSAAHKFIVLITDGFPTTYVETTAADGTLIGYDTYNGTRFRDRELDRPCSSGTSYSDEAALRAENAAKAIRNAGINIVSVGIDVNNAAQTIQTHLDNFKNSSISVVDREKGDHPDNYVIGHASNAADYRKWLGGRTDGTGIGGGPDIGTGAYYTGDSLAELNTAFVNILKTVANSVSRAMNEPLVLDPMGAHVGFLGFYDKSGNVVSSLDGSHTEGGENSATYSSAINWRVNESGFTKTSGYDNAGNEIAIYTYTLKYRVRLENELADFVEGKDYFTNDDAVLKYMPPDEDPDDSITPEEQILQFPDPQIEGYLGELTFDKTNAEGQALAGAEFTLTHNANCSVCEGKVTIHEKTATADAEGRVSFARIPSGHEFTLTETKAPDGYQSSSKSWSVAVAYGVVTVDGKAPTGMTVSNTPVTPVDWTLSGTKTVDDGMTKAGYTFRMTDTNRESQDAVSDADGKFTFKSVTFSAEGEYGFEIREVAGNEGNLVYDDTIYYVRVKVVREGNAYKIDSVTIRNSTDGSVVDSATFHNAKRTPAHVQLGATKILEAGSRMLKAGEFTFVLKDANEVELQRKTNTDVLEDNVTFDALTFTEAGTYTYTISEVIPDEKEPYMVYDETVYTVEVTVSAPEDNTSDDPLTAKVVYKKDGQPVAEPVFTNEMVDSGTADFQFTKYAETVQTTTNESDEETVTVVKNPLPGASFTLTHVNCNGCAEEISNQTATSNADGVVSFANVPSGHTYLLTENPDTDNSNHVTIGGVTYQTAYNRNVVVSFGKVYIDGVEAGSNAVEIVNVPTRAARVVLAGIKTVDSENNLPVYDNAFHFELQEYVYGEETGYTASGLNLKETNIESANDQGTVASRVVFDPILFQAVGTHYYKIWENPGNYPGMVYDSTVYYVVVDVAVDEAVDEANTENLVPHVRVSAVNFEDAKSQSAAATDENGTVILTGIDFKNLLRRPVDVSLKATKILNSGKDALEAGEFTFQLKNADGKVLEEVSNAADGSVTFSKITYSVEGTHHYTISEKVGSGDRVKYDTKVVQVIVNVTPNGNTYAASVTYDGAESVTFTNAYHGQLLLAKTDESGNPVSGAEFTLSHKDDCCNADVPGMVSTSTAAEGSNLLFMNIPSGHSYVLTETVVPQGYVQAPDHIVVVEKGDVTVYEANDQKVEDVVHPIINHLAVTIHGDKVLVGRDLKEGEFRFLIQETDSEFAPQEGGYSQTVTNTADGAFNFALPFTNKDANTTHYYKVSEVAGDLPGVAYSQKHYHLIVNLDENMKSTITFVSHDSDITESGGILFTNTYTPAPVAVTFSGTKYLEGRDPKDSEFFFQLYSTGEDYVVAADAVALELVSNAADGSYSFSELTYRGTGTFHYVIRELDGGLGGVTYDENVYEIEVVVTDDLNGQLSASIHVDGEAVNTSAFDFTNNYTVSGDTQAVIHGTKQLTGRELESEEFSFQLVNASGTVIQTVKNDANGYFAFAPLTYDAVGTHSYQVKEVPGSLEGVTYDAAVYDVTITVYDNGAGGLSARVDAYTGGELAEDIVFENTYVKPGELILAGNKILEGKNLEEKEFTFTLQQTDAGFVPVTNGESQTAANAADGSFAFDAVKYEKAGTYYYVIRETAGDDDHMVYDTAEYRVTVTVAENETGKLTASAQYQKITKDAEGETVAEAAETLTFTNTYTPEPTDLQIGGTKILTGMELTEGAFSFQLMDAEGQVIETVANDADGSFAFGKLDFTVAGTYTYTVREVPGEEKGIIYDETVYTVVVDVLLQEDGSLKAEAIFLNEQGEKAETLAFVNSYSEPGEICVPIVIHKTVVNQENRATSPAGFKFRLADEDGKEVAVLTSNVIGFASHAFRFDEKDVGKTYVYTVEEIDEGEEHMTYSDAVYTIRITIGLDEENHRLTKVVTVNRLPVLGVVLEFVNIYDEPEEPEEPTDPTEPEPTDPEPTDPKPTDPEPTDPRPTEPKPTDPEPTKPTEPEDPTQPIEPTDPEETTEPEETTKPTTKPTQPWKPSVVPVTGDQSGITTWVTLMLVSAGVLILLLILRKPRGKYDRKR